MKLYILQKAGVEYNDEYNYLGESGGGAPVAAFRSKANAEAKAAEENAKAKKEGNYQFEEGSFPNLFTVKEVEVADEDTISYSENLQRVKAAREASEAAAKGHLTKWLEEIFASELTLDAIRWDQYTPYFCDGDTCYFGVNEVRAKFAGTEPGDEDDEDDEEFEYSYELKGTKKTVAEKVQAAVSSIAEEDMESVFGDHVQVTYTRDKGFEVEEYEHD